ncbi:MAG: caspase family protein, partial [Pirellulales bacterium]
MIATAAEAEHRAALLIGNSDYPDAALSTPARDVAGLAAALSRRGFQVTVAENLNEKQLQQAAEAFAH